MATHALGIQVASLLPRLPFPYWIWCSNLSTLGSRSALWLFLFVFIWNTTGNTGSKASCWLLSLVCGLLLRGECNIINSLTETFYKRNCSMFIWIAKCLCGSVSHWASLVTSEENFLQDPEQGLWRAQFWAQGTGCQQSLTQLPCQDPSLWVRGSPFQPLHLGDAGSSEQHLHWSLVRKKLLR